jgi:hypothetical protein
MTRYYVDISPSLVEAVQEGIQGGEPICPDGWRLVKRFGPRSKLTERWIVEDDEAGDEYEDMLVMPIFTMTLIGEGPEYVTTVSDREIVQ